ncbi:hypothetical protein ACFQ4C_21495 [Larkinella insperata]|uniref:T9SS type A sorting domain-containing protein n=1 Tax=Larkinella insperata TaxID=332158 RepID=A0ABW3QHV8_9BACT
MLYDLSGRKVLHRQAVEEDELYEPAEELAPGLYLLEMGQKPCWLHRKLRRISYLFTPKKQKARRYTPGFLPLVGVDKCCIQDLLARSLPNWSC